MNKRSFLKSMVIITSGFLSAITAWGMGKFVSFSFAASRKREFPKEILSRVQPGVPFHVPEAGVWLVKMQGQDTVSAMDDKCPHLGCKQNWNPQRNLFECPCHGSEFDIQGNMKKGPAAKGMPHLHIQEVNSTTLMVSEKARRSQ
ncbi:MAG: cytochrome b6-f complex iron-sulfur subunit [Thermodesulfobacteriota bacterium]|nr:cytochrome b6-f complex iron-sulfur subunit [Thermodesulfobacteriota bacterium]